MVTFSVIKADTGGFVGHSAVHPRMLEVAGEMVDSQRGRLLPRQLLGADRGTHAGVT